MGTNEMIAQLPGIPAWVWIVIVGGGLFLFVLLIFAARYRKAGPNEALIIFGGFGKRDPQGNKMPRIIKGGGGIVWPIIESYEVLSLELMTIDIIANKNYTITGVPINVDSVAQIKVRGDDVSISTAAERFLSMGMRQVMEIAKQTLEGHLRAIVGTLTVEEIYKDRDMFTSKVQEVAASDMANMGLSIDSFTLRDIQDEEGYLFITGRTKDLIIRGGENISTGEIEDVLESHPKIAEAAVIGVPDAEWGEVVKAVVVLAPGEQATPEEIASYCKERLASYKAPAYVAFVSELPRNPLGKMLKTDLRKQHGEAANT